MYYIHTKMTKKKKQIKQNLYRNRNNNNCNRNRNCLKHRISFKYI